MTKITELILDEGEDLYGVDAISLVEYPAIEQNFVFLSQEKNKYVFAKEDDEKKLLVGPALIPNKQIYRMDQETGEEYYAHFSKETIRRVSELYLQKNNHHNYTYEHENKVGGLSLFESWIVDFPDMDKSRAYGFEPKEGWWMVSLKVHSDELWAKIKSGEVKGFSIEGYFADKIKASKVFDLATEMDALIKKLEESKK